MKRLFKASVAASSAAFALLATPAFALTYYLTQDLGVRGNQHLCKYSNGKIYTVNATELCPLQVEDNGPANVPNSQNIKQTGFLKGQYQDGMTKVCIYEVLGRREGIRLNSYEICPITYDF